MERDPIVEETPRLREEYATEFAHDRDAIFDGESAIWIGGSPDRIGSDRCD